MSEELSFKEWTDEVIETMHKYDADSGKVPLLIAHQWWTKNISPLAFVGKVLMDQNKRDAYLDTVKEEWIDSQKLYPNLRNATDGNMEGVGWVYNDGSFINLMDNGQFLVMVSNDEKVFDTLVEARVHLWNIWSGK